MDIFTLPKAELHCHLDGSLPLATEALGHSYSHLGDELWPGNHVSTSTPNDNIS